MGKCPDQVGVFFSTWFQHAERHWCSMLRGAVVGLTRVAMYGDVDVVQRLERLLRSNCQLTPLCRKVHRPKARQTVLVWPQSWLASKKTRWNKQMIVVNAVITHNGDSMPSHRRYWRAVKLR